MSESKTTVEKLSFEQALGELEAIVEQLERGDVSLDVAIDAYARGMSLKTQCQARLEEARLRVEKIKVPGSDAGAASTTPFDPAEV